jgi:hypothetical protein
VTYVESQSPQGSISTSETQSITDGVNLGVTYGNLTTPSQTNAEEREQEGV